MGQSPSHEGFTAPWVIGQYVSSLHVYADGVGDVLESVAAQQLGQTLVSGQSHAAPAQPGHESRVALRCLI